jgi:hypothetical protein
LENNTSPKVIEIKSGDLAPSVDQYSSSLEVFIDGMNLPTKGLFVEVNERKKVIVNLPDVIGKIPKHKCADAMYVSKFVAACIGGLFDAAINYLWNETVINLRDKAVRFDLDYFFASAIDSEDQRKNLKSEDDLKKIDDWALIRGCRQTGILSEIGFKNLDYVREMRNWASAAHPNHTELTGLQLVTWLETCIREVLAKEPEGPAVEVRTLLHNIRNQKLRQEDIAPIAAAAQRLPQEISRSLLRTIFGMYVDSRVDSSVKDNIRQISVSVWNVCSEDAKYEIGLKYGTYSANGDVEKKESARKFLDRVSGMGYLPTDSLAVELSELLDNLLAAHVAWSNYANEIPHAKNLAKSVPESGAIPQSIAGKYVKTLLLCRLGDANYGDGVSAGAKPFYDKLFDRMQERDIFEMTKLLCDNEIMSRLQHRSCQANLQDICRSLRPKLVNVFLIRAFDLILISKNTQLPTLGNETRYKNALKDVTL